MLRCRSRARRHNSGSVALHIGGSNFRKLVGVGAEIRSRMNTQVIGVVEIFRGSEALPEIEILRNAQLL